MLRNEKGSIVVETMLSFTLFVLLCWCILAIIIMTTLQTRVHYALTQTAVELSVYAYVIKALGFADNVEAASAGHAEAVEMFSNISTIIDNLDIQGGFEFVGDVASDPRAYLTRIVQYAAIEASHELIVRPIFFKYLDLGGMGAEAYLQSHRVVPGGTGLIAGMLGNDLIDFSGSYIVRNGNTRIVATYRVDFTFGFLPMPENMRTLEITQSVMTKAWLGGYGEGFTP